MQKKCLFCGNLFTKKVTCSKKSWSIREYCSISCSKKGKPAWNKGIKGTHFSLATEFKKGQASWKKGIKMTPEQLEKQRTAMRTFWDSEKGKLTREKISKTLTGRPTGRTGSKCNFWKGGKTPEYQKIKNSLEWKNWRRSVFERDNYTCQECGVRSGNGKAVWIHPHHIKSRTEFPELQFDVNNGITLCRDCHRKTHNYGIKAVRRKGSTGATS